VVPLGTCERWSASTGMQRRLSERERCENMRVGEDETERQAADSQITESPAGRKK